MTETNRDAAKRRGARAAVSRVEDGMVVGLGSGSTAGYAIDALGTAVDEGLEVVGVPTSHQSADRAREAGVPLMSLQDVSTVSLAIDGADQVAGPHVIKGGGAAHAREKLVDTAAQEFVVVVDPSKHSRRLDVAVPIEVLHDARRVVSEQIGALGGTATVRTSESTHGPLVTDNGHLLLDADFGQIDSPAELATALSTLPGVLEHGLFIGEVDTVITGTPEGTDLEHYENDEDSHS